MRKLFLFVLLFCFCSVALAGQSYQITESQLSIIENENERLLKERQTLKSLVQELKAQSISLNKSLTALQTKNKELATSFNKLEVEKAETVNLMATQIEQQRKSKEHWKGVASAFICLSVILILAIVGEVVFFVLKRKFKK